LIETISTLLLRVIRDGDEQSVVDDTREMLKMKFDVVEAINSIDKYQCYFCKEIVVASISKHKTYGTRANKRACCVRCKKELDEKVTLSMGCENRMDPLYSPSMEALNAFKALPDLSELESMLIAKAQPIMKVSINF